MPIVAALLLAASGGGTAPTPLLTTDFRRGLGPWTLSGPRSETGLDGLRIVVPAATKTPWDVSLSTDLPFALNRGARVRIVLEAASPDSIPIGAHIERGREPYAKFVSGAFALIPALSLYTAEATLSADLSKGDAHVTFHLGRKAGRLLVRSVRIEAEGLTPLPRRAPADLVRFDGLNDLPSWNPAGLHPPRLASLPGAAPGLRAEVGNPGDPWNAQIGRKSLAPVRKGDLVEIALDARSEGSAGLFAVFEEAAEPNAKTIYATLALSATPQTYRVTRVADRDFAPGEAQFKLFFTGKGAVEVANLTVRNLGPDAERKPDALGKVVRVRDEALLREARANIERLRKGPLALTVRTPDGEPLANAPVRVELVRHAFRWGTAAPAGLITDQTPEAERFRAILAREFNTVTFENDLKWRDDSPALLRSAVAALPWLHARRIAVRGHNLVWGGDKFLPEIVKRAPTAEKRRLIQAHVREYVGAMKGKVYVWDGVNEAVENVSLWNEIGWEEFAGVYKLARELDPSARLAYNEYAIQNPVHRRAAIERVKTLQRYGAPIDLFGDQAHFDVPGPDPRALWEGWTEIGRETGLPVELTELDFGSFDDDLYAGVLEDVLTLAFGHPNVEAVVLWGFWEGAHWRANEGGHLVNRDFTFRKPMRTLDALLHKTWSTDATLKTDARGRLSLPAFYGTYRVSAGTRSAPVEHPKGATVAAVTLR